MDWVNTEGSCILLHRTERRRHGPEKGRQDQEMAEQGEHSIVCREHRDIHLGAKSLSLGEQVGRGI